MRVQCSLAMSSRSTMFRPSSESKGDLTPESKISSWYFERSKSPVTTFNCIRWSSDNASRTTNAHILYEISYMLNKISYIYKISYMRYKRFYIANKISYILSYLRYKISYIAYKISYSAYKISNMRYKISNIAYRLSYIVY